MCGRAWGGAKKVCRDYVAEERGDVGAEGPPGGSLDGWW